MKGPRAHTYVCMAAEFDGHGAGKQLKERYNKKSPQQLESYKKLYLQANPNFK